MRTVENSKWYNLLWSAVITACIAMFCSTRDHSQESALDSRFILFILAWGITLVSSPVILLLRLLRVIPKRSSFLYILTGTINLYIGVYGSAALLSNGLNKDLYQEMGLCLFDLFVAAFIFVDVYVRELPGLRRRSAAKEIRPTMRVVRE